jgi:hypothetical protein
MRGFDYILEFTKYVNKVKKSLKTNDLEKVIEAKEYLNKAKELLEEKNLKPITLNFAQTENIKRKYNNIEIKYNAKLVGLKQ